MEIDSNSDSTEDALSSSYTSSSSEDEQVETLSFAAKEEGNFNFILHDDCFFFFLSRLCMFIMCCFQYYRS